VTAAAFLRHWHRGCGRDRADLDLSLSLGDRDASVRSDDQMLVIVEHQLSAAFIGVGQCGPRAMCLAAAQTKPAPAFLDSRRRCRAVAEDMVALI
jgi:hypothetical protein